MQKTTLLIATLLLSLPLFSQLSRKLSYGIEINPKVVTSTFNENELTEFSNLIIASMVSNVYLDFSTRYSFKTGLSFNFLRIDQIDYSITFGCDFNGTGADFENSWIRTNYSNYYIGLPLENKLNITNKKHHPYVKMGGEFLFLVGASGDNRIYECGLPLHPSTSLEIEPFPVLFLLDLGIGFEFCFEHDRKFYIEPQVEYSVDRIFQQPPLGTPYLIYNNRILNIGIVAGIRFK